MNFNFKTQQNYSNASTSTSVTKNGLQKKICKSKMSKNQDSQRVLSRNTKTSNCNGVTETVVTEVIELPNGVTKTTTKTTRSGISTSNQIRHQTNGNDNHPSNQYHHNYNSGTHNVSVAPSDSDSSNVDTDFAQTCLKFHNHYRAQHGVPNLVLSQTLSNYAQEWANKLAREDSFRHRDDHKYGENIYMQWSSKPNFDISGKVPVDSWYSEIKDHVFGVDRPSSLTAGHFTQVIWKESKTLGVGKAKSRSGKILVVCNYDPPGNMFGRYASMVPRKH